MDSLVAGYADDPQIIPAEQRDIPAQQLTQPIGTGPFISSPAMDSSGNLFVAERRVLHRVDGDQ
jgi:hypothetical protein